MTTELMRDVGQKLPDAAVLRAIHPSACRMATREEAFVRMLHEEIEPLVRRMPEGGWPFCERTARAVLWLALSDPPPEAVFRWMHWLGEVNHADGFPPSEYVSIGHALVWIAREMTGAKWSTATGSAWIRFFMWLQPLLQAAARRPAVPQQRATFQGHAVPQRQATFQEHAAPQTQPTFTEHTVPQQQATFQEHAAPQTQPTFTEHAAPQQQAASWEQAAPQEQATSWEQPAPQEQASPRAHVQAAPREEHPLGTGPQEVLSGTGPQQTLPAHEAASLPAADTDIPGLPASEDEPTPVHDQVMLHMTGPQPREE
jgi:hypothetical protein